MEDMQISVKCILIFLRYTGTTLKTISTIIYNKCQDKIYVQVVKFNFISLKLWYMALKILPYLTDHIMH